MNDEEERFKTAKAASIIMGIVYALLVLALWLMTFAFQRIDTFILSFVPIVLCILMYFWFYLPYKKEAKNE